MKLMLWRLNIVRAFMMFIIVRASSDHGFWEDPQKRVWYAPGVECIGRAFGRRALRGWMVMVVTGQTLRHC